MEWGRGRHNKKPTQVNEWVYMVIPILAVCYDIFLKLLRA